MSGAGGGTAHAGVEVDAIGQWAYRNAPFPQQTCAATCAELLERQYALPSYTRTASELATLEQRVGLWARAVPVLSRLTLVGTAGYVGWRIGSGLRTLWMSARTPSTMEVLTFNGATLFPRGQTMVSLWGQPVAAPSPGWLLDSNGLSWFYTVRAQSPCPVFPAYPPVPVDGSLLTRDLPQPAGKNCYVRPSGPWVWNTPEQQGVMFLPAETSAPVLHGNQPYSATVAAGSDPGLTAAIDAVRYELEANPSTYGALIPWLGEGLNLVPFPKFVEKWNDHADEFPEYEDPWEYWKGASDIVRRWEDGDTGVERCERFDGAFIYYDIQKGHLVIVKNGEIETFFKPDDGYDYYNHECERTE